MGWVEKGSWDNGSLKGEKSGKRGGKEETKSTSLYYIKQSMLWIMNYKWGNY